MEINKIFKNIVGFSPYDFQLESIDKLCKGKSIILIAPTGSGKTEIPVISFLLKRNETFPSQMIYSLPTRTLIENLSKRIQKYSSFKEVSTAFHHGKRIESEFFSEDIIITTIDQTIGAYVCLPLSAPKNRGNIFAGSVSSSFLVFDEIHTYDPERALQTAITLIRHTSKLGLPFLVMSATLPKVLLSKIRKINSNQTEVIEVEDENEIKSRKKRKVTLHTKCLEKGIKISTEEIRKIFESSKDKKLIVIVNTVERAQKIYTELNKSNLDAKIILIHSRFLEEDKREKEELLQQVFSSESKEPAILISTQVIEVGVDISSDIMISEIAPIDSLIQRAGRCARWGGRGDFYIYDVEDYAPYNKKLVEKTKNELIRINGEILSWDLERCLVNKILSKYYKEILTKEAEILGKLARAHFYGEKNVVEECIRDIYTCEVSIHDNPEVLCNENNDILRLQKVNVNVFVFRAKAAKLLEENIKIWVIEENNILDDYSFKLTPKLVKNPSEILPYKHYIIFPEGAYYGKDVGLVFGIKSLTNFDFLEKEIIENKEKEFLRRYEPWIDHAKETLQVLDKYFIPKYSFVIKKFSEAFDINKKDLIEKIRIAVALHDIGKLNKYWQEKIGWDKKTPLAHSDKTDVARIGIPHATVSSYALSGVWGKEWYPILLAIAHHHSPYSQEYKPYKFINGWERIVEEVLLANNLENINLKNIIDKKEISDRLEFGIPYLGDENNIIPYRFYVFLSKILRLSDWIATSGEINGIK